MISNTQRTLKALKEEGAYCDIVERYIKDAGPLKFTVVKGKRIGKRTGVRKDLFGIIDIIALYPNRKKICGIQSCGQAFSEHKKKILSNFYTLSWLRYADLELWGWRKLKKGKREIWMKRVYKFSLIDLL